MILEVFRNGRCLSASLFIPCATLLLCVVAASGCGENPDPTAENMGPISTTDAAVPGSDSGTASPTIDGGTRLDAGSQVPLPEGGTTTGADAATAVRDGGTTVADGATTTTDGATAVFDGATTVTDGATPAEAGASGDGGPTTCQKGQVKASEVVFIGESFIAQTGAIPRMTTQLARTAGTIAMSESYRSKAVSGTQLTTGAIPRQFTEAVQAGPVKVVLMDGGGNDLLLGSRCKSGFDSTCKEIVTVVETLFKQMKMDGVKDVVYFFYPDPMGVGASIKGAMDILRPEMKKACDGAKDVRCVWADLRESWMGNYGTFTSDGIHPTEAGSMASAKQIWQAMVANCIAQ